MKKTYQTHGYAAPSRIQGNEGSVVDMGGRMKNVSRASDSYNVPFTNTPFLLWAGHTVGGHLPNYSEVMCSRITCSVKGTWVEMKPFWGKPWRAGGQFSVLSCQSNATRVPSAQTPRAGPAADPRWHVRWRLDCHLYGLLSCVLPRQGAPATLLHSPFRPCPTSVLPSLQSITFSWPFP